MSKRVTSCGGCGGSAIGTIKRVLSVGTSPPSCNMAPVGTEPVTNTSTPLRLLECTNCSLVQLSHQIDPEDVFPAGYTYSSGNSAALHRDFEDLAEKVSEVRSPDDLIVDIGANDGTLLSKFQGKRIGVEPTDQVEKVRGSGIEFYKTFFGHGVGRCIEQQYGKAKVITACNVMAHSPDLHDMLNGVKHLLTDDGIFVAENGDLDSIGRHAHWDTVYHEHLRYYSPYSFAAACGFHGLYLHHVEAIPTHGGSFRAWVSKKREGHWEPARPTYDWDWVQERASHARYVLRALLADIATRKEQVWGISATARASTIIGYCGLTQEDIQAVAEVSTSDKLHHYMPGTNIPILDERLMFRDKQPEWALLFSWHMADDIVPKLREAGLKSKIIIPLPTPRFC